MEREELLQEVQTVIEGEGKNLSPSISEETINAELDDELENINDDDDDETKQVIYRRIAKRLMRIDGNIHSNVSREVKDFKAKYASKNPKPTTKPTQEDGNESEELKILRSLTKRMDDIEQSRADKAKADAKNAAVESVKKGLRSLFKEAKVEVNEYIYRQTLRDLEVPEVEDGRGVDTEGLIKKMERAYYRNLKEAGLDKKDTAKPHAGNRGGSGGGQPSKLDLAFRKHHPDWAKK